MAGSAAMINRALYSENDKQAAPTKTDPKGEKRLPILIPAKGFRIPIQWTVSQLSGRSVKGNSLPRGYGTADTIAPQILWELNPLKTNSFLPVQPNDKIKKL